MTATRKLASCLQVPLTTEAYHALNGLDKTLVGTADYMGVAFFWSYEYRHLLRDARPTQRKRAHDKLLEAGLAVDGESEQHMEIIRRATR